MIPFASQRGLGQDLATHLLNEHDNEFMEVADIRGAIAQDLHGAFAEWEIQADCLTRCRNYLYSLSVNPDPRQEPLTREQYLDYIVRVEEQLGLLGQPRAIVFHEKYGREHCHVVWSRINTDKEKAVQLAFDHDKLMMVTHEFAREHDLQLPEGYEKGQGTGNGQLSVYEMHQQRSTGLTKEERKEQVTDAWRESDSAKAFVQALAARGYILATGKRPYVLVDIYGQMNALPKLIGDKTVRTKDIRAFLEADFPPESLPTVEEAKKLAAQHLKVIEGHREHEQKAEALVHLRKMQAARREKLEADQAALRQRRHKQREALTARHKAARDAQRAAFLARVKSVRIEREERRPQGLAAFFGRVSGIDLIRKKLYRYRDRRHYRAFLEERNRLRDRQEQQRRELARHHEMQSLDLQRKIRALDQIDKRELKSLDESLRAEQRITDRGGRDTMPAIRACPGPDPGIDLEPHWRPAAPRAGKGRRNQWLTDAHEQAMTRRIRPVDLEEAFTRAASGEQDEGKTGTGEGPAPQKRSKADEYRRHKARKRNRDKDRER